MPGHGGVRPQRCNRSNAACRACAATTAAGSSMRDLARQRPAVGARLHIPTRASHSPTRITARSTGSLAREHIARTATVTTVPSFLRAGWTDARLERSTAAFQPDIAPRADGRSHGRPTRNAPQQRCPMPAQLLMLDQIGFPARPRAFPLQVRGQRTKSDHQFVVALPDAATLHTATRDRRETCCRSSATAGHSARLRPAWPAHRSTDDTAASSNCSGTGKRGPKPPIARVEIDRLVKVPAADRIQGRGNGAGHRSRNPVRGAAGQVARDV